MEKKNKLVVLCFNEKSEILTEGGKLPRFEINVEDPSALAGDVYERIKSKYGVHALGEMIYDGTSYGTDEYGIMMFLENLNVGEWTPIGKLDESQILGHLNNTLFNANVPMMGQCYYNTKTTEGYYIIHTINDNVRGTKFLVIESTMAEEPMILPSDSFWGMPIKWISHAQLSVLMQDETDTLVKKARKFFIAAHNSCNSRYDGKPYSHHLSQVIDEFNRYKHLIPEADWDHVESELWGHDCIEDTPLTFNDVKKEMGHDIAMGCWSMTNDQGRNRDERNSFAYYTRLAEDRFGEFKKLCDRLANTRNSVARGHSMGEKYKTEYESFKNKLNTNGDKYAEMWSDLEELLKLK
jgi:hypothetical protein